MGGSCNERAEQNTVSHEQTRDRLQKSTQQPLIQNLIQTQGRRPPKIMKEEESRVQV